MGLIERIRKQGFYQKALIDALYTYVTNFNAVLTKLDADGTVTDTDYSSLFAITTLTIASPTAKAGKTIQRSGMLQGDIIAIVYALRTNFNALMDKLAADGTVNGTTVYTNLKFTGDLINVSGSKVMKLGVNQGDLVTYLDDYNLAFNSLLDLLDADTGVADTTYASLWGVGDVVEISSSSSSSRSSSSSSRSSSSSSCSSSSCSSSSCSSSSCSSSSCSSSRSSSSSSCSSCSSSSCSSSRSSSSSSRSSSSSCSSSRSSSSSSSPSSSSSRSSSSSSRSSSSSSCSSSSCSSSSSSRSSSSSSRSSSSSSSSSYKIA